MKVVYTHQAVQDLAEEYEYRIGRHDLQGAQRVDAAVAQTIERLARRDFEGPLMTLRSGQRVRSWPVPPFRVIYTRDEDVLIILRVYHQARPPLND